MSNAPTVRMAACGLLLWSGAHCAAAADRPPSPRVDPRLTRDLGDDALRDGTDRREAVPVPLVLLEFDAPQPVGRFEVFVQFVSGHPPPDLAAAEESVAQVAFRLRF
jgi:hypothetical protein